MERADYYLTHTSIRDLEFGRLLKTKYSGNLRDRLLFRYLDASFETFTDPEKTFAEFLPAIESSIYKVSINDLLVRSVGRPAFQFSLPDKNEKLVSLSDQKGKVVFIDFYYYSCVNCSRFFRNNLQFVEDYFRNNKDVVFITISIDASKELWEKSLASGRLTTESVSNVINLFTGGHGDKHPIIKHYNIEGYPTSILIGKDGRILEYEPDENKEYLIKKITKAL